MDTAAPTARSARLSQAAVNDSGYSQALRLTQPPLHQIRRLDACHYRPRAGFDTKPNGNAS